MDETQNANNLISIDQFKEGVIQVGTVLSVETIEGADKLLKLEVDLGEEQPRQILSGIREHVGDGDILVGRQMAFVTNLEPRKLRGFESHGMILATGGANDVPLAFLEPSHPVPPGSQIR